jgi:transposase, IS4 family
MITKDKIIEIFCIADDFCKEFESEINKIGLPNDTKCKHRRRKCCMSKAEIIMLYFHFYSYCNFQRYYMFFVKEYLADMFPHQLSYNRFWELEAIA